MMKKWIAVLVVFCMAVLASCTGDAYGVKTAKNQIELSMAFRELTPAYFLDDGSIFCKKSPLGKHVTYFYRYYPGKDKLVELGKVENMTYSVGLYVAYGDNLYTFSWIENKQTGEQENTLLRFDLKTNSIELIKKEGDGSYWGNHTHFIGGDLVTMKNEIDGDKIYTYIETYDLDTGTWNVSEKNTFNRSDGSGGGILASCADGEYLYNIVEIRNDTKESDIYFMQFDRYGNEVKSFALPQEFRELIYEYGRYVRMEMLGDYLFLQHISLKYSIVAEFTENSMRIIREGETMDLPADYDIFGQYNPVLFDWYSSDGACSVFNIKTGEFRDINIQLPENVSLKNIYQNKSQVFISVLNESDPWNATWARFIVDTDELGSVCIGDENTVYYSEIIPE